jgi:hypothetical protein
VTAYGTIDPAVEMVLREFTRARLYGAVEVKFEAGRVVLIRKSESIKPADLNNRIEDDQER